MIGSFKRYILNNKYELFVSFLLFTNLFPREFPGILYYISFVLILIKFIRYNEKSYGKTYLFYVFIAYIWFSTILGLALDLRLLIFSFIIFIWAPRKSIKWHNYKLKLLRNIFIGFGIATLANFYAKIAGINQVELDEYMEAMGRVQEFAGFCTHSMWTSAAGAISSLFFVSLVFSKTVSNIWWRLCCLSMALISYYIIAISGSRSAFVLSLGCSLLIVLMNSKKVSTLMRNIAIVVGVVILFSPVIIENSGAMLQKKNAFEITTEGTSRDELWAQRMAEFKSSPILGIGFAAHGVGLSKEVGRNESGGGYISVLAQTGIIGILFLAVIWFYAIMLPKRVGNNSTTVLTYCVFVFMVFHSIFEGYLFQGGWYLCMVIWLIVGVMIEHKDFSKRNPQLMY